MVIRHEGAICCGGRCSGQRNRSESGSYEESTAVDALFIRIECDCTNNTGNTDLIRFPVFHGAGRFTSFILTLVAYSGSRRPQSAVSKPVSGFADPAFC